MLMRSSLFTTVLKSFAVLGVSCALITGLPSVSQTEQEYLLNVEGNLTADDEKLDNGLYVDVYELDTVPDQNLVILYASDEYDTYLYVFEQKWHSYS